jgi:hypothetical protein
MAEALLPNGPFHSLTLTDERQFGEQLAEGLGIAAMVTGMLGSFIPEPQVNRALTKVAGIITKLTPVARKIDFFKSTASVTTLDDKGWRTRQVTHYFSPAERSARRQATTTAAARY